MDYPVQVWYGVYFSGEDVRRPLLPDWVRNLLERGEDQMLADELSRRGCKGADLAWVYCGGQYGLAVPESVQTIRKPAGELTNYPVDIADIWVAQLAPVLEVLDAGSPTITWYVTA